MDFITQLVFPFLYCLGHSRQPVIKTNAAVPCCMAGTNKELRSYTLLSSLAATSHVTAATMQGRCLFTPS